MGLMIDCEEASKICTKTQYKEATLLEKIKLNIHLLLCKICGKFAKQNNKLTQVCNQHLHASKTEHTLTEAEKEAMKEKIAEAE